MTSGIHAWLFGDLDRARLLDMDERLQPVVRRAMGVLAVALLICSPWLGAWTLAPLTLAAGLFRLAHHRAPRSAHPEYILLGAWLGSELIIGLCVALTGGPKVATMTWLAIPIVTLPARFSQRVVTVGVGIALGLLGIVAFATNATAVIAEPPLVIGPAAAIIAVAMLSMALMRSDLEHRDGCWVDDLTGLWNRRALTSHAEGLMQKAAVSGESVAAIFGDIDNFKQLNDNLGHPAGDAALRQVADRLRAQLRAFDFLYRYGGEEIAVLLPGASLPEAVAVAEDLRQAVSAQPLQDGSTVTMSFGVSSSEPDTALSIRDLVARADAAMYEAKSQGRDQVCAEASRVTGAERSPQGQLTAATAG